MENESEKPIPESRYETQHQDAARTTTESGAAAAAGWDPVPSQTEAPAGSDPTANKVNAGSSDR